MIDHLARFKPEGFFNEYTGVVMFEPAPPAKPRCQEKRSPKWGTVQCERDEGHEGEHIGRGAVGQWFIWETPLDIPESKD
jgi:hypothetical protein